MQSFSMIHLVLGDRNAILTGKNQNTMMMELQTVWLKNVQCMVLIIWLILNLLMVNWGSEQMGGNGDFDYDGVVGFLDFNLLMIYWTSL